MLVASVTASAFTNPQDLPAVASAQAPHSPLLAVARAGARIVAVGLRGHIVFSDDGGKTWTQAPSPVSSDLLAVSFPSPRHGWAVGHGGVVLHSADGGSSWVRQLEGRQASNLAVRYYESQLASHPQWERVLQREKALAADGGTQALLDVHFDSETTGFVVGTFNRIYRTEDAGKTWTPWMDRTDNPNELHFYTIRSGGGGLYLAGEQGMVWRLDAASQRFVPIPTPYKGTLFGLVAVDADNLLVFGMRGSLFRSGDQGRSWARVATSSAAGMTAGTTLPDGSVLLVNQAGGLEISHDKGQTLQPIKASQPMSYYGVTPVGGSRVGLVGAEGVRIESIAPAAAIADAGKPRL
jgi:photosystem II stability/assembly factor-like uncharacterized protein